MTQHSKKLPLRKVRSAADKAGALEFEGQCLFCMRAVAPHGGIFDDPRSSAMVISGTVIPAGEYVIECEPWPAVMMYERFTVSFAMCAECGPALQRDGSPTPESIKAWLPKLNDRIKWAVRKSFEEVNVKGRGQ